MHEVIPVDVRAEIVRRLELAEREHGVKILLAIESGSRAWGFWSPNSDFDVRFIYVRPRDWYLSVDLEDKRDVIEYPIVDDIDMNGWDLRKALRLFLRSNPAFVEWIQSPITYVESGPFRDAIRALLPVVFSPERGRHHYRSMAKANYRDFLRADLVPLKKYFYVLRPVLARRWIDRFQSAAPIEFERLLAMIEGEAEILGSIATLLEKKRAAPELGLAERVDVLNAFIESEIERADLEAAPAAGAAHEAIAEASIAVVNALFRDLIAANPA